MSAPIPASYSLANLPRYTSYPTAPHFGPLAEEEYRRWLSGIGPPDTLSLYVHIPFCNALCWYCGCHTTVTRNADRIARYGAALRREAAALAGALPPHAGVAALHLGGGTPSTLGAHGLRTLFAALRASFAFRPEAEMAIELDPRLLDAEIAAALAEAGVTRASLGVQDIAATVQQKIGRPQSEECVAEAVGLLRGAGVRGINLDLMYGLPGQTRAHVAASARFATALRADRIAVFGYAHVPWMKPQQKAIRTEELPGAVERLRQAEVAAETLAAAGYRAIGLDHYARPDDSMAIAARDGRLRRNFQGYTTDGAPVLLGLGASAIGAVTTAGAAGYAGYAQNEPDERRYVAAVERGELPVRRGRALTAEDRLRRDCIEQVMCGFALELDRLPPALLAEAWPRLQDLAADGILRLEAGRLRVTQAGERHARHVAACFDAYLGQGIGRHSAAV